MYTELWIIVLVYVSVTVAQKYNNNANHSHEQRMKGLAKFEASFTYAIMPDVGYEPYWIDGDYKIHDPTAVTYPPPPGQTKPATKPTVLTTTKQPPMVCGEECHLSYRSNEWSGCWRHDRHPNKRNRHCWNEPPDTFWQPFKEFNTYCEYLEATCRDHYTKARYSLLHVGKCKNMDEWFKPLGVSLYGPPSEDNAYSIPPRTRLTQYPLLDMKTSPFRNDPNNTEDPLAQIKTRAPTTP